MENDISRCLILIIIKCQIQIHVLEGLSAALMQYANAHAGRFPPHDYVSEVSTKLWEAPDSSGTRYIYVGGLTLSQSNALLVCEPQNFGEDRLTLFTDGRIQTAKPDEIHRLMGAQDQR